MQTVIVKSKHAPSVFEMVGVVTTVIAHRLVTAFQQSAFYFSRPKFICDDLVGAHSTARFFMNFVFFVLFMTFLALPHDRLHATGNVFHYILHKDSSSAISNYGLHPPAS